MVGAEEAELAHHGDEFAREAAFAEAILDDGDEVVFDEVAGGAADEEFVFREAGVEMKEVEVLEFEGHFVPDSAGCFQQIDSSSQCSGAGPIGVDGLAVEVGCGSSAGPSALLLRNSLPKPYPHLRSENKFLCFMGLGGTGRL